MTNLAGTTWLIIESSADGTGSLFHTTPKVRANVHRYTRPLNPQNTRYLHRLKTRQFLLNLPMVAFLMVRTGTIMGEH